MKQSTVLISEVDIENSALSPTGACNLILTKENHLD